MSIHELPIGEMRLYAKGGRRLYVNAEERRAFLGAADRSPAITRLLCLTLAYTGCRLSEARFMKLADVQLSENRLAIHTLKRRKSGIVREVPIPDQLVRAVARTHFAERSDVWLFSDGPAPPSRIACYRKVKTVMLEAGIEGLQACPKGLRHGYGIHAIQSGVQLHMLQKWMGHASMTTTAIYATAVGPEEQQIAARMWS